MRFLKKECLLSKLLTFLRIIVILVIYILFLVKRYKLVGFSQALSINENLEYTKRHLGHGIAFYMSCLGLQILVPCDSVLAYFT